VPCQNLAAVAPSDALHAKLTRALEADETKLEQLSRALDQASAAANAAHQTLSDAASMLQV
jgi:hypothetical protein